MSELDNKFKMTLQWARARQNQHQEILKPICEAFGYGATMKEVETLYRQKVNEPDNLSVTGSNFVVGPCESATVPCECDPQHGCDWCCGCGWLTKHVKQIKDQTNIDSREKSEDELQI